MIDENDLLYRLSYRIGQLRGRGFPFSWLMRRDIELHSEAVAEIAKARDDLARLRSIAA